MTRLLLFLFFVVIVDQNGIWGNPVRGDFSSILQVDFSDSANELQAKRSSHRIRVSGFPNRIDPSSRCYFIQESETESRISCRLRFPRSKFNFNPFGLRFGKRQENILTSEGEAVSWSSGQILQALLKLRPAEMINPCGVPWQEDC